VVLVEKEERKKKSSRAEETLEGWRMRMRNLLRAGRGLFRSELWRSAAAAKLDSQHAASTEHPQTTTAFSPATYRLPRHTVNYTLLSSIYSSDIQHPNYHLDTHLRASPIDNPHSEVSTPPAHISFARSLSILRSCPIKIHLHLFATQANGSEGRQQPVKPVDPSLKVSPRQLRRQFDEPIADRACALQ
jgi:hypothetical protein